MHEAGFALDVCQFLQQRRDAAIAKTAMVAGVLHREIGVADGTAHS